MKSILMSLVIVFASGAFAKKEEPKEPPIRKGASITVLSLDRKTRTLLVQIDEEKGVGPNIARPEALVKAIGISDPYDRKRYLDDPVRFVGASYILQENLELIVPPAEPPPAPKTKKK